MFTKKCVAAGADVRRGGGDRTYVNSALAVALGVAPRTELVLLLISLNRRGWREPSGLAADEFNNNLDLDFTGSSQSQL